MNPKLVPIVVFLSIALLVLYIGTFLWFAYAAVTGTGGAGITEAAGPLSAAANEAVAYVWTTVSLLVGGVVAVAFGQPAPEKSLNPFSVERLVAAYAWAFMGVGLAAVAIWILMSGKTDAADTSLLIKNAAVAFFGLAIPILTSFLRLPANLGDETGRGALLSRGSRRLIEVCADFSLFPDNAPLPGHFELAGFTFDQAPGGAPWFVNDSGERGLQFDPNGGRVQLPGPVDAVDLRVGAFAGGFDLQAEDTAGNTVAQLNVPGTNSWTDERLSAPGIAAIVFRGGGSEAAIEKICVKLECGSQDH